MKIAIIGAGHIGANLARQFAKKGHQVTLAFPMTSNGYKISLRR